MATEALAAEAEAGVLVDLLARLASKDWQERSRAALQAASVLRSRPEQAVVDALGERLVALAKDRQWQVRQDVAAALEHLPQPEVEALLQSLAKDTSGWVSNAAKHALRERRRLARTEEREGKRIASVMRRIRRLEDRCSFDVAREIEEVGLAYYQAIAFGCSHDIMNLVNAVHFSLRGLREELERRRVPRKVWQEVLENAERRSQIVKGITQNMRALAKQSVPAVRRITLRRAVDEAVGIVRDRFGASAPASVEAIVEVPRHLKVEVPRDRLLQALVNLIQNAFEAIRGEGRVTLSAVAEGESVFLSIADTGCGIRPEDQQLVFFPGKSTKKGRRETEHNTGWGLSLARKFVEEDCHGELHLESTHRVGTTVTLALPQKRAEEEGA